MSAERRRLPRTGGGMVRLVAQHVVIAHVDDRERVCKWLREVALNEGAEGWVAPQGEGLEAWFEGPPSAVEGMVIWCRTHDATAASLLDVSPQRPCLKGGFDVLDEVPPS